MEATETQIPQGKTKRFKTPSGDYITVREQNGNDDDIISNSGKTKDGSAFNEFIAGIVVKSERADGPIKAIDVLDMPLRDKYSILIQSRIFSLGENLTFTFDWGDAIKKDECIYEDDLSKFVWDYDKPFPVEGDKDYFSERIPPYEGDSTYFELELSSGHILRLDFLNGNSEKYMLKVSESEQSANVVLKARRISLKTEAGFHRVETFTMFSARDMSEIRSGVKRFDSEITLDIDVEHPTSKMTEILSLIQIPDFFFPVLS